MPLPPPPTASGPGPGSDKGALAALLERGSAGPGSTALSGRTPAGAPGISPEDFLALLPQEEALRQLPPPDVLAAILGGGGGRAPGLDPVLQQAIAAAALRGQGAPPSAGGRTLPGGIGALPPGAAAGPAGAGAGALPAGVTLRSG
jgi:hypothetical protein